MYKCEIDCLVEFLFEYSAAEGIYDGWKYDLDVRIPLKEGGFNLWVGDIVLGLDEDGFIIREEIEPHHIPIPVCTANARLIQNVIRSFGKDVLHTWGQQYCSELRD